MQRRGMPESGLESCPESGLDLSVHQQAPIPLAAQCLCAPGEVLALVGPSGSGKSTLLRCIAGLVAPRTGRIVVGRETWLDTEAHVNLAPQRRHVGFVFQNYGLFPHLSALDNVREGLNRLRLPAAVRKKRARALLELVHLAGLEERLPRDLSGGQQQRVAVARALAGEPRVLLLDEPFSAVDRVTREKLQNELSDLRRHLAMPVILVTHDLEEAMLLADRLCVLSRGRTLQTGAPLDVLEHPATAEVARLLGLHNVFPGRIVAHRQDATVLDWQGQPVTVAPHPHYPPGRAVWWMIPVHGVLLRPLGEPSSRPWDTPLNGAIETLVTLGDRVRVAVRVTGPAPVILTAARHIAERYGLRTGKTIPLRLRGEHVHLMPWDE